MTRRVMTAEELNAVHAIRATLRDCGIEADVWPPYEAPIPVWHRTVGFGDADENGWPYTLELTDDGCEITDRAGDPVGFIAGAPDDQRVASAVALCAEVLAMVPE